MKVIIPVAGAGTRLKPHTITQPKALLHVGGKPVLAHVLEPLVPLEPEEVIFVVGHHGDQIMEYVRKHFHFHSRFVPQEKLLGLGYALHLGMTGVTDEPVLVILGDTVVECDCKSFLDAGDFVLGLREVEDPERFGIAEVKDGFIVGLEEKPPQPKTNLALIGLYYFHDSAMLKEKLAELVRTGTTTDGEIQLTDALHRMIEAGVKFAPYEVEGWLDCGKKETLLSSNREILMRLPEPEPIDGSVLVPPVFVAPSAKVVNSVIGPNVSVAEGAVVERSVVQNSILGEKSHVKDMVLDNSLVGQRAVVRGGRRQVNVGDTSRVDDY